MEIFTFYTDVFSFSKQYFFRLNTTFFNIEICIHDIQTNIRTKILA